MARRPASAPLRITPAKLSDLEQIMEIEALSFASPWSRKVFLEEFGRDFAYLKVLRTEDKGRIVAFINYWVVHDEIHVLNVATHPDYRRQGLGRRLMEHVLHSAQLRRSRLVTLEVRKSNQAAIELYTEFGFKPVGIRPRYYENQEDAVVMVRKLKSAEGEE